MYASLIGPDIGPDARLSSGVSTPGGGMIVGVSANANVDVERLSTIQ
jgi:hypothetical protein